MLKWNPMSNEFEQKVFEQQHEFHHRGGFPLPVIITRTCSLRSDLDLEEREGKFELRAFTSFLTRSLSVTGNRGRFYDKLSNYKNWKRLTRKQLQVTHWTMGMEKGLEVDKRSPLVRHELDVCWFRQASAIWCGWKDHSWNFAPFTTFSSLFWD